MCVWMLDCVNVQGLTDVKILDLVKLLEKE